MTQTSNDKWTLAYITMGVGACVVGVGACVGCYYIFKKPKRKPKKSKAPQASSAPSSTSSASTAPILPAPIHLAPIHPAPPDYPHNDELIRLLMTSMETMQSSISTDGKEEQQLHRWVHAIDFRRSDFTTHCRLVAAQWLILFSTISNINTTSREEYNAIMERQARDMNRAWMLTECNYDNTAQEKAADLLKLDIAQRLKDHMKMSPVFDRVVSRGDDMKYEEVVVAFTTAPLLGRWSTTRMLGDQIKSIKHNLEQFHEAASARSDIPDYKVLYDLAEEEAKKGDASPDSLKWQELTMSSLFLRLESVECDSQEQRDIIFKTFHPENDRGMRSYPVGENNNVIRFGALAQMLSRSVQPIPMVGPADDLHIKVHGYAESTEGGTGVRQSETYYLERPHRNTNLWKGQYTLIQESFSLEGLEDSGESSSEDKNSGSNPSASEPPSASGTNSYVVVGEGGDVNAAEPQQQPGEQRVVLIFDIQMKLDVTRDA